MTTQEFETELQRFATEYGLSPEQADDIRQRAVDMAVQLPTVPLTDFLEALERALVEPDSEQVSPATN